MFTEKGTEQQKKEKKTRCDWTFQSCRNDAARKERKKGGGGIVVEAERKEDCFWI